LFSESLSVSSIPNPRNNNGWVTQIGNYVTADEIAKMNQIIDKIEKETTVEIAVVIIPTTDGDVFNFTQNLFDLWKIGKKDKNNGILIVASMEEREFRTHTGYGIEPILPDGLIKIQQERIVIPRFKAGLYGLGIIEYLEKINSIIVNPDVKEEIESNNSDNTNRDFSQNDNKKQGNNLLIIIIVSLICIVLGFLSLFDQNKKYNEYKKKEYTRYSEIKNLHEKGFGSIGGLDLFLFIISIVINLFMISSLFFFVNVAFIIFAIIGSGFAINEIRKKSQLKKKIINNWRTSPRVCPECGGSMNKLSEIDDDKFLSQAQVTEEKLKSYDYDVWLCSNCKNKTIEQYRDRNYHFYIVCPKCNGLTAKQVNSTVISYPTYTSSGQRKLTFKCEACQYEFYKYVTIPRLERTTSSSGGSFGGGGSSGGGGFGGGSFGGGSSGGGGASSKW